MIGLHNWQDCYPVVISSKTDMPLASDEPESIIAREVFLEKVTEVDRRLFHQYCCLHRFGDDQVAAIGRIRVLLAAALPKD